MTVQMTMQVLNGIVNCKYLPKITQLLPWIRLVHYNGFEKGTTDELGYALFLAADRYLYSIQQSNGQISADQCD